MQENIEASWAAHIWYFFLYLVQKNGLVTHWYA